MRSASRCCTTVLLSASTSTKKKIVMTDAAAARPKSWGWSSRASHAVNRNVMAADPYVSLVAQAIPFANRARSPVAGRSCGCLFAVHLSILEILVAEQPADDTRAQSDTA